MPFFHILNILNHTIMGWCFFLFFLCVFFFFLRTMPLLSLPFHAIENCFIPKFPLLLLYSYLAVSSSIPCAHDTYYTMEFPDYFIKIWSTCRNESLSLSPPSFSQLWIILCLIFPPRRFSKFKDMFEMYKYVFFTSSFSTFLPMLLLFCNLKLSRGKWQFNRSMQTEHI